MSRLESLSTDIAAIASIAILAKSSVLDSISPSDHRAMVGLSCEQITHAYIHWFNIAHAVVKMTTWLMLLVVGWIKML